MRILGLKEETMLAELTESVRETIKSGARKLTRFRRRQFQAETAVKYCQGNQRRAEQVPSPSRKGLGRGLFAGKTSSSSA